MPALAALSTAFTSSIDGALDALRIDSPDGYAESRGVAGDVAALLVPQGAGSSRGPQPARAAAPDAGGPAVAGGPTRRRATLWQDSSVFQDSFFGSGNRAEGVTISDFGALRAAGELPGTDVTDAPTDSRRTAPPLRH